jgi:hypothetical protein
MFTMADVEKILEYAGDENSISLDEILPGMEEAGVRFKFDADEPTFTLRGRDQRAIAAIRYYGDHQSPTAPVGFLEGIQGALSEFERYRHEHPAMMKQPD